MIQFTFTKYLEEQVIELCAYVDEVFIIKGNEFVNPHTIKPLSEWQSFTKEHVKKQIVIRASMESLIAIFNVNDVVYYNKIEKLYSIQLIHAGWDFIKDHDIRLKVRAKVSGQFHEWFQENGRKALYNAGLNWESVAKFVSPQLEDKGYIYNNPGAYDTSVSGELSRLSNVLPGIKETVKYPCKCHTGSKGNPIKDPLHTVIMHLNDTVKWSREEIADWIETLDVDTTFKTGDEAPKVVEPIVDEGSPMAKILDKIIKEELQKQYEKFKSDTLFEKLWVEAAYNVNNPNVTFKIGDTGV